MRAQSAGGGEQGFALLLVLWSLVALTVITSQLIGRGRAEVQIASNLRSAALAEMLADGGVHAAMFQLLDPDTTLLQRGRTAFQMAASGGEVSVTIEDQAALVNPNTASAALLAALLTQAGAGLEASRGIAASIEDWRSAGTSARQYGARAAEYRAAGLDYGPPGAPFRTTGELGLVMGMNPVLLAQILPSLSVLQDGEPDPATASPFVRRALRAAGIEGDVRTGPAIGRVVAITAVGVDQSGGRFTRRATVRLGPSTAASSPVRRLYQILDWQRIAG